MQSHTVGTLLSVKKEANEFTDSRFTDHLYNTLQEPIEVSSSSEENDSNETGDDDEISVENASKQLVVYHPLANGRGDIVPAPQPIRSQPLLFGRPPPSRALPSVGAFTIQCAKCYKWRLIPTKEKYEETREHILEKPFYCETTREWRPDISCNDKEDISQDGSRPWAIDRPNIAQPPRGWQRLLRIRGEGSTKFADLHLVVEAEGFKKVTDQNEWNSYVMPQTGCPFINTCVLVLCSTIRQEVLLNGRNTKDNYVRKRPSRVTASCDDPRHSEVNPISWARPGDCTDLQLGRPALEAPPSFDTLVSDLVQHRAKKRAKRTPPKQVYSGKQAYNQCGLNLENHGQATMDDFHP